jgi:hypothetical protein
MPKIIQTTVYEYAELNDKAKQAARDWLLSCEDDQDACDIVKEDAERVGFTLEPGRGHFEGTFADGAFNAACKIRNEHGPDCDTYKAAIAYEAAIDALPEQITNLEEESRNAEAGDVIEEEFRTALEKAYLKMLDAERLYRASDEYLAEGLEANEYTFTENGKRFG